MVHLDHVLAHDRHLVESLLADSAHEWLDPGVGPVVVFEVPNLIKDAVASVHQTLVGAIHSFGVGVRFFQHDIGGVWDLVVVGVYRDDGFLLHA